MKFGLIGYPIAHSLSPTLFKAGYDGIYPYDLIEDEDFDRAYQRFLDGYHGVNVTAPFKEPALKMADIVSDECMLVGATNLLVKTPEGVKAYNSDYRGVLSILRGFLSPDRGEESVLPPWPQGEGPTKWEGFFQHPCQGKGKVQSVLIVGTGGAGKAAAAAAKTLGFKTVLMNRTQHNPEILPLSSFREEFRKADIIIYNLPVRIQGIDSLCDEDFNPGQRKVLMEANYKNPSFDKDFIQQMTAANPSAEYIEGRKWLLMQAVTGYELFTGRMPDAEAMERAIKSK